MESQLMFTVRTQPGQIVPAGFPRVPPVLRDDDEDAYYRDHHRDDHEECFQQHGYRPAGTWICTLLVDAAPHGPALKIVVGLISRNASMKFWHNTFGVSDCVLAALAAAAACALIAVVSASF
jgi:hypothetical protein